MKSEFKAKLLNHLLNRKNAEKGFTLIELLVVIIIIGILAAIALPSFLNQANKARQSEAKTYVGSMNRAQQAYFLEKQQFACNDDFGSLGLGIPSGTDNYGYFINPVASAACIGAVVVTNQAQPAVNGAVGVTTATVKAYIGGVNIATPPASSDATTLATLCEADTAPVNNPALVGTQTFPVVAAATQAPQCPANYQAIN
ncbi:general secretion pathway protein H [Thalassoporum mexicanum PCC 7367]|uniref:type IV pilin-like G/H family protein n=1 Tax=Thalassoporum mexicanum TaxID=3457544 RepID=UPI00029FBEEE|nr:type IV pilin-like G/H family protein [Pseudanabaena sp. PCC 7367]AFY70321.1 general secretion pathway protein H [Pseudanabaena sp. PCC 7367]